MSKNIFTNSNINNSGVLNFGKIKGDANQTIQQLPESDNKLKEQLTQLAEIIENSKLPDEDKQDALQETQTIAEAKAEQPEKQKSMIAKALRSLKRIGGDLQSAPEVLEQYSEIIERIGDVF